MGRKVPFRPVHTARSLTTRPIQEEKHDGTGAMEAVVSLVLGFPWRRGVLPLPSLESQAPSARVTTASISLSQQDYDRLKKEGKLDETTQYLTT